MHEADYFYDSPDSIHDTFEKEVIHNDWIIRNRNTKNHPRNLSKGRNKAEEFALSWKFRGDKDNIYYKPNIEVSPMTI